MRRLQASSGERPGRYRALRRIALVVGLAAATVSGCAYESAYVAPADGRARPVWKGNDVVVELAGAPAPPACLAQLQAWSSSDRVRLVSGDLRLAALPPPRIQVAPAFIFWVPIYYGPPIVPLAPGVLPLFPHPLLFSPSLSLARAAAYGAGGPSLGRPGDQLGRGLVVLAAIALVVLPIVDIALAAAPPETARSSDAIDQVNVFNDLARTAGTPCTYGVAP